MTYHNASKFIANSPIDIPEAVPGSRIRLLWERLGNPQRALRHVRLTGSNGKTVCAQMLLSAYRDSGYAVGYFSSSQREEYRRNIFVNGEPLSHEQTAFWVGKVQKEITELNRSLTAGDPSTEEEITFYVFTRYEVLLTVALLAFVESGCRLCFIESNHLHADPSRFLPPPLAAAICGTIPSGDTKEIQKIRSYIGHGIQEIVSAPQDRDAYRVISDTCATINCRLTIPARSEIEILKTTLGGSDFSYKGQSYRLRLCGKFQIFNAVVVLEILEMLSRHGFDLPPEKIKQGFLNTKIPCKLELLGVSPTIIVDSTHSDIAIETVCESLNEFRTQLGSEIVLCLPEGAIVDRYKQVLGDLGYPIAKVVTFPFEDFLGVKSNAEKNALCRSIRAELKEILHSRPKDSVLLISGPYCFASEIRRELLNILGF